MRDKNLFPLLLGLNAALALAFVVYLVLSSQQHPQFSTATFPVPEAPATHEISAGSAVLPESTEKGPIAPETVPPQAPEPVADAATNKLIHAVLSSKTIGWQEVESDVYQTYLNSLRAVGCPEDKIRYIVLADINECIAKKRLQEAITHDAQWWRAEPEKSVASLLRDKGLGLEDARRQLIARWLGEEVAEQERDDTPYWSNVQLTGPVLGAIPADTHQVVQQICADSMDRYETIFWGAINSGQPLNQVDLANLRERTRSELVKILNPDQVEEFLLRYSHNANRLRQELRGFDPTADEFRQIFRAIDPIDHAMQTEFGSVEAMSQQQRERYENRRSQAIRDVLSPARLQSFFLTKDPLYRQAQMMALQYGAPSSAILPIYQVTKENENRRKEIMQDAALTTEQKRQAINAAFLEQQENVRKIASEAVNQPRTGNP